jgi:primosomal protein N''
MRSGSGAQVMLADYLRQQATLCQQWARECFDLAAARRLRLMADAFVAKARELESEIEQESQRSAATRVLGEKLENRGDAIIEPSRVSRTVETGGDAP